jgi:5-methyltetrahydrofolate--homocysteine methyltransferase
MQNLQDIMDAVVAGNIGKTKELVGRALGEGTPAMQIITEGLSAGLGVVGAKFKTGEMFLPEMVISATAAKAGITIATQNLGKGEYQPRATMVLGTVEGDLHDIGKNLVALVLRIRGFEVIDLGVDVHEDQFIAAVREQKPEFLGMSCLMTTTMNYMKDTIDALARIGLRDTVKVVVGGCPVTQDAAFQMGADGCARNMAEAIDMMERLMTEIKG